MSQKKPIWTSVHAHERLKAHCSANGRTQLEVVSELIMTHLLSDGKQAAVAREDESSGTDKKTFGGVWVV